tara:strand:+ start:165 stop:401 length:237 start_codon:yes stop_codon:yes gene_type:complete
MQLGQNMFTSNLNRRFYTRNRINYLNRAPFVPPPAPVIHNSLHKAHAYVGNPNARIPKAFGKSMYSKPPSGGGCGCGK